MGSVKEVKGSEGALEEEKDFVGVLELLTKREGAVALEDRSELEGVLG